MLLRGQRLTNRIINSQNKTVTRVDRGGRPGLSRFYKATTFKATSLRDRRNLSVLAATLEIKENSSTTTNTTTTASQFHVESQNIHLQAHQTYNNVFLASTIASSIAVRRIQPALRVVSNRHVRGPLSVLLLFGMFLLGLKRFILNLLARRAFACDHCHGYGIERCRLCGGMGFVGWEGKFSHLEPCPLCCAKRYTRCTTCGGLYHRKIFKHARYSLADVQLEQGNVSEQGNNSVERILSKFMD